MLFQFWFLCFPEHVLPSILEALCHINTFVFVCFMLSLYHFDLLLFSLVMHMFVQSISSLFLKSGWIIYLLFVLLILLGFYLIVLIRCSISQDLHSRNLRNEKFSDDDDDVPSAPPFSGSASEIKQKLEQVPATRAQSATCLADTHPTSATNDINAFKPTSESKSDDHGGNKNSDQLGRFVQT